MASLKDVKTKIGGVTKTKQITKAMYMVASAKLRGAQSRIEHFRPYAAKFYGMLRDLAGKADEVGHPLLVVRDGVKAGGIVLTTADRGLCGSFNINLISAALKLAAAKKAEGKTVRFYCIGKKGRDAVRKLGYEVVQEVVGQMNNIDFQIAGKMGLEIILAYEKGDLDEVYLVYGEFAGMARQVPITLPLLPIVPTEAVALDAHGAALAVSEYTYEPSEAALLAELLPRFIKVQIHRGLLDTSASEHAARMAAMDNATRNCDDLVADLTLLYNKTRQASITTELIDIVGGVEALNG